MATGRSSVVAVLLGTTLLHERLLVQTFVGPFAIALSVAQVNWTERTAGRRGRAQPANST